MNDCDPLPPLRDVIAAHGLNARKELGQNFLLDMNLTRRIARVSGSLEGISVIEVGPGPGGLTRALLMEGADKVIAIERDPRALPILEEISAAYPGRLEIVLADALEVDYGALAHGPTRIIANLPYNIATPLLTKWLSESPYPMFFQSMVLMFQKEVALRICAEPGSKAYGRLSILSGWLTEANIAFDINASAFTPPPKVTSSLVHFLPRPDARQASLPMVENITRAAFGQRRKMIRQSLKSVGVSVEELLAAVELKGTERAETLPVSKFLDMAEYVSRVRSNS